MSDKRNALLLCALQRAGRPIASDDLLDQATGLALADGWLPEQIADLTRRSISTRLRNMEQSGLVRQEGAGIDERARRATPLYVPTAGYDLRAPVPPPPGLGAAVERTIPAKSAFDRMDKLQLLAVLEAQDELLESVGRFFHDLRQTREKVRARLLAAGLE